MITQEEKEKRRTEGDTARVAKLEEEIKNGLSGERLLTNPDWLRLTSKLKVELDDLEIKKIEAYDSAINGAFTIDQKVTAVDVIKIYKQTIADLRFYIYLPEREAKRGQEAREELTKLRGGD